MDILFIFPPISIEERYGSRKVGKKVGGHLPPMGLSSLAAYIREKGFSTGILDCPALEYTQNDIIKYIKDHQPKVIGLSCLTPTYYKTINIAKKINEEFPEIIILLGGAHATLSNKKIIETEDCFDFIVIGEGELTVEELMNLFKSKDYKKNEILKDSKLKAINGIIFKTNNKIISTPQRPFIDNLDDLPFPARDVLPMKNYMPLPLNYKRLPIAHMVTSRGCPFNCTYCSESVLSGRKIRKQSPSRVVKEIKFLQKEYGIKEIAFWDDTLTLNKQWMKELCEIIINEKIDITWTCYARVDTVDKEMLENMKKAGCWNIFYGVESGSEILLENIKKKTSLEKIRKAVQLTKEAGIEVRASFMLALPGEDPKLAMQTINFAIELDPDYAQFCITTPYPGTELYNNASKWGKLNTDFRLYNIWEPVFVPFGYHNKKEIVQMEKRAMRKFYLRPSFIMKKILKIRSLEDFVRYAKGFRAFIGFA